MTVNDRMGWRVMQSPVTGYIPGPLVWYMMFTVDCSSPLLGMMSRHWVIAFIMRMNPRREATINVESIPLLLDVIMIALVIPYSLLLYQYLMTIMLM